MCSSHDHVRHFILIHFVLSWLAGVPLQNGIGHVHKCVSWRLASEIVAGENRLVKFHNAILASHGLHEKTCLLCEKFARDPRSAKYVQNKSHGSNHVEVSVFTPEMIGWRRFEDCLKKKLPSQFHMAWRKCFGSGFLGRKTRTLNVCHCQQLHRLW